MKKSKFYSGKKVNRNPGLYLLEYWKRDNDGGWSLDWTRSGGSLTWARLCAESVLKPIYPTRSTYHRDLRRADFCVAVPANGPRSEGVTFYPKAEIVPSVGELGYW